MEELLQTQEFDSLVKEELERRRHADFYLDQPYLFQREVLCPPELRSKLRPFHEQGLEWATRKGGKRLKLILWPRGHLKSTIFTQGESVRRATANPNIRIHIKTSTTDLGETFLSAIKGHFRDPRYQELYGSVLPNNRSGKYYRDNKLELTLLSRTQLHLKEPTITVSGLESTKTSQHYDLIFHDDLVVRENVGNYEQMDKVWKIWQDSLDLLEPDGEMYVIGTRWHPLDLYGRILSDYVDPRCFDGSSTHHVPGCHCQFDVSVMPLRDPNGLYIFDSKFDDTIAAQLLSIKGQREFSAQYENNPSSPDATWFNEDEVQASLIEPDEIETLRSQLVWYMAVDPAESLESRSSYTAVVCVGVDHASGVWYVDYAKQGRVDTAGFIDLVFDSHMQMKPHRFGMETATRKALEYVLMDKMALFGHFWTIEEVKPAMGKLPNAKEIRIRSLRPLFTSKHIRINKSLRDLISILITAPSSPSLDLADALAFILQMVPKGLGSGDVDKKLLPVRAVQNKGLSYVVPRSGTQSAPRRLRVYSPLQFVGQRKRGHA